MNKSVAISNPAVQLQNKGMTLEYVAPTLKEGIPIACLDKSEIEKAARKWKTAIILYVIGESPTITYLAQFLEKQCLIETKPEIYYHNDDYFVIRFETLEERDRVLYDGPHTLSSRPVIVKEWAEDFCFEMEILKEIPLWVQVPKLPLKCWGGDSLSRIGSVLGRPLCAEECTTNQTRISYARLLVEVDVTQPLKYSVLVEGEDGKIVEQKVLYEWVLPYCKKCNRVGHTCREKVEKVLLPQPKKQWQKKLGDEGKGENEINGQEKHMELQHTQRKDEVGWTIPKRTTTSHVIQVGNIQIATGNTY